MNEKRGWLGALALASFALLAPYAASADPVVFVNPADDIPPPPYAGDTTFIVPVEITGAVNLTYWQFDLTYDPNDVQIVAGCDPFSDPYCNFAGIGITEGPFFGSLSPFNVFDPGFVLIDAGGQIGELIAVNDRFGGDTPPSGDGILAYVEFVTTATGTGESPITVTNVSTESSFAPEPATLALVAGGLVLLGRRRLAGKRQSR